MRCGPSWCGWREPPEEAEFGLVAAAGLARGPASGDDEPWTADYGRYGAARAAWLTQVAITASAITPNQKRFLSMIVSPLTIRNIS